MAQLRNQSDFDKLESKVRSAFNQLDISRIDKGVRVSVPNGTKSVIITLSNGIYTVEGSGYKSTYRDFNNAKMEILECLVAREMYDNNFTSSEVNLVINKLLK